MRAAGADVRIVALQRLLSECFATPVTVDRWERLEPWAVSRARLRGTVVPSSVVVKWMRGGDAPKRLRTEVAALRFLSEDLGVVLAPRVIAVDFAADYLVLEDLAPRVALDRLLRHDGAAAHGDRLTAYARIRGELGAVTAGTAAGYYARRAELGPVDRATDLAGRFAPLRAVALEQAAALGAPVHGPAEAELTAALDELHNPGPFLALSNGDAEANNVMLHPSGPADARLIDFEFAGCTHTLTDAVCLHVPGPGWMTVGDPSATGLADQYRRALARGIPQAEDDRRYGQGLAAACMSWALIRLQRFASLDARAAGDRSRPQLVATLEATADTAAAFAALPHLTGWSRRVAALLRRRWPDADLDFSGPGGLPPYQPRA